MMRSREKQDRSVLERLWGIVAQLPDGVLLVNPDGVIVRAGDATKTVLGPRREPIEGRPVHELCAPEDRERLLEGLSAAGQYGSFQGTFRSADELRGGSRWLELHLLWLDGPGYLLVARDVTKARGRERNLRLLVDGMQSLAGAGSIEEVYGALWTSLAALLPDATYLWLYAGEGDRVRMVWSSREDAPPWSFSVQGWGARVAGLLSETDSGHEFLQWFGQSDEEAREKLERMISGRGGPLLLSHPKEQLRIYLGERELDAIVQFWGDQTPGQLIHCLIISEGELELLAVIDAPPGRRPFTEEDADWAWQLVGMAHQVLCRIEAADRAAVQLSEVRTARDVVRHVGDARCIDELLKGLCRSAVDALDADRMIVYDLGSDKKEVVLWSFGFTEGVDELARRRFPVLPVDARGRSEPLFLADASRDQAWRGLGGETTVSVAAMPLVVFGESLGVVALFWDRRYDLEDVVRPLSEFLAGELALVLAYRGSIRDVEGRESLFGELTGAIREGVIVTDAGGRIEHVGGGTRELLASDVAPDGRSSILSLPWGGAKPKIAALLTRALAGQPDSETITNGAGRCISVSTRPGGRDWIIWFFSDVRESMTLSAGTIWDALPLAVVRVDQGFEIVEANEAARDDTVRREIDLAIARLRSGHATPAEPGGFVDIPLESGRYARMIGFTCPEDGWSVVMVPEAKAREADRLRGLLEQVEPAMSRLNDRATALIAQLAVWREESAGTEHADRVEGLQEMVDEILHQVKNMAGVADRALRGNWEE